MNIIHLVIIVIHLLSVYSYCVYFIVGICFATGIIVIIIVSIIVIIINIIVIIIVIISVIISGIIAVIIVIISKICYYYYCDYCF